MRTEIKSVRRPVFEDKLSQEELKEEILKGKRAIDEGRYLSVDELRAVLADKSRAGHTAEIRELLKKYGASKLSLVDPKHYEALLREAEVL